MVFHHKPHFFGFYGDQGSAKTTFFNLVSEFIGDEFIVSRSLKEVKDNKFASSDFWNAKIYCEPDMASGEPLPDDFIKALSGQTKTTVEEKWKKSQNIAHHFDSFLTNLIHYYLGFSY